MVVLRDVMVMMRDGIRLATDIYLPGDGAWPVLLERTPYNKCGTNHADRSAAQPVPRSKPEVAADFVNAGYAYVLQDCRGRFASEGEFTKYVYEAEDGIDMLEWLRLQPWCDGRIGTLGLSYGAHTQAAMASLGAPGLGAMIMDSGGFASAYHSGIRQGGAYELKQLTWAVKHAALSPRTAADPIRKAALAAQDVRNWMHINPWRTGHSPISAAPEYEDYIVQQWADECFNSGWQRPGLYARGHYRAFPDVPMLHVCSWYDPYAMSTPQNFQGLTAGGRRAPGRLVMGPWTHGQRSVTYAGEVDFGPSATLDGNLALDYTALRRTFLDHHLLLKRDVPDPLPHPVSLFIMGGGPGGRNERGRWRHGGCWRFFSAWPPPEARATTFHLSPDGSLSAGMGEQGCLSWDHDPAHPVPSIGGAVASGGAIIPAGAYDQREREGWLACPQPGRALADRPDILVFRTARLDQDVTVVGPIMVRLYLSSTAVDTDLVVKLVDEYPAGADGTPGFAMNLCHGIIRARFRDGFEQPRLMLPGQVYGFDIEMFPTANRFQAGHRIRLDVASSHFPHFDVNAGTGAPAGQDPGDPVIARNTVHLGPPYPSHLILPIVPDDA
ncbi:antibiotic hydrolase [Niveispirillum lacus]|uniref:Antibiotic hydrolase n=2 Tax=Niveispirillum lacus TaxID=1981099 RepID=A0A255YZH0_9PROT|nr:antibiotic hydrolase [Niveispirillum lacus]